MQRNAIVIERVECKAADWDAATNTIKGRISWESTRIGTRDWSDT